MIKIQLNMEEVAKGEGDELIIKFTEKFTHTKYSNLTMLNETLKVIIRSDIQHEKIGKYSGMGFSFILTILSVVCYGLSFFSNDILPFYWSMFFTLQIVHSFSLLNLYTPPILTAFMRYVGIVNFNI